VRQVTFALSPLHQRKPLARKILLADDSVTAQNMGRKILADAGYEVITVNNGSAALKKVAETKPDIIILDVYMPGYNGLEVCQRLKEVQETSRIPILLTVGKLEPFKPEEAKRVRAEGFIVKPFEASELLSALSKLEDKIVPRAEPSKPGRFARANAALDEGRYDKTVAVEEDSGWKNRIAFPSKKKKAAQEEDGDDPAIYNAVNKDLRTMVEHKPAPKPPEAKAEEARVDLGALAPEGLPKDVTAEEIAALAAAAAQVKGKLAETVAEPVAEPSGVATAEYSFQEAQATELRAQPARTEQKPEAKEAKEPTQLEADRLKESTAAPATFAVQKPEEQVEQPVEAVKQAAGVTVPSPAEMMAAIAGMLPDAGNSSPTSSGNGLGSHASLDQHAPEHPADEPVTMAVAAGAGYPGTASRWTAVSVALAPDEVAIPLEHEMQKADAAFAAAEIARARFMAAVPEMPPFAAVPPVEETISPVEAVTPELVGAVPSTLTPGATQTEPAQSASAAPDTSTETISAAVKEFQTVAAWYMKSQPPFQPPVPAEPEAAPAEPVSEDAFKAPQDVAASAENPGADVAAQPEITKEDAPAPVLEEQKQAEHQYDEPAPVEAVASTAMAETSAMSAEQSETAAPAFGDQPSVSQVSVSDAADRASANQSSVGHISSDRTDSTAPGQPVAAGPRDMARKESDIAETTAAAWASWRRIRESGDSRGTPAQPAKTEQPVKEEQPPQDAAAMAVAAGAETSPEEVPAASEDSGELASIVDSVLANMRPQIVEEISRKLGKKK
jgi:CheY-like chemotaxis protein